MPIYGLRDSDSNEILIRRAGMGQATDAIVTGFTKAPLLLEQSIAPLRLLQDEGILRNIHYVTWDSEELDSYVAPAKNLSGVTVTRVPLPIAHGTPPQKSMVYQIQNLKKALSLISEDDALVLKLRPDFVAEVDFLRDKLVDFESNCAIDTSAPFGIKMPNPTFQNKIWIPWSDSNQPFFCEDAAFLGRKSDLLKLVTVLTPADMELCAVPSCGHFLHIVRFAKPFLSAYPLFANYLRNFRHITSDMDYRMKILPHILNDAFFWFLVVSHAWILHSEFHIDCGEPGDLLFYPNTRNLNADWSRPATWQLGTPYDRLAAWRQSTKPGSFMPSLSRPFGRLVDDDWQRLLMGGVATDMPRATLVGLLEHISQCKDGRLREMEQTFYKKLETLYHAHGSADRPSEIALSAH